MGTGASTSLGLVGSNKSNKPRKRIPVSQSVMELGAAEQQLQLKLFEKVGHRAHRGALGPAYKVFTDGHDFPQCDFDNFEYGVNTRLNMGWSRGLCERMFRRFDSDHDGVISFQEFNNNMVPKDTDESEQAGFNIKATTNTLLGYHAARAENPRRPRRSRLVALRAKGLDMPPVPAPPTPSHLGLPARQSNFNPINPESAWDLAGAGYTGINTSWIMPATPDPRDPRRRKMDQCPPPTPHMFKSFRV